MEPYIQYILIAEFSILYACMITLLHRYFTIPLPPIEHLKEHWGWYKGAVRTPRQLLLELLMGAIVIAIGFTLLYAMGPKYATIEKYGVTDEFFFVTLLPYKMQLLAYWFALLLVAFFLIKTVDIWKYTNTGKRISPGIRYIITPVLALLSGCTIIITLIGSEQFNQEMAIKTRTAIFIVVIVALITYFILRKIKKV